MRKTLLLFAFCLFAIGIFAQQRSESEALKIAESFLEKKTDIITKSKPIKNLSLAYTSKSKAKELRSSSTESYYYVFNIDDNGFIIVSGEERANSILGYSYNGSFDINSIPDNFKGWLSVYEEELKDLFSQPVNGNQAARASKFTQRSFPVSVAPLLGNIKWNQSSPYNDKCPVINVPNAGSRAVTGCVATAMAQVMKYYQWPEKGEGSNSYVTTTLGISINEDFSTTYYDWGNMSDMYGSSNTSAQKEAVATLMYHCGVAVNMNYNTSSGALNSNMVKAFKENFSFDPNIETCRREYYTKADWENEMKVELSASRPVLYSGQSSGGGHMFVCDGYDANGLFHFNWGWGGTSDGYFETSALNPTTLGIGGGTGGYNSSQYIYLGVQKPGFSVLPVRYQMFHGGEFTPSANSVARNTAFSIQTSTIWNFGSNPFVGTFGLVLIDADKNITTLKTFDRTTPLNPNYGTSRNITNITVPESVTNGTYELHLVYKENAGDEWAMVKGQPNVNYFLDVTVTSMDVVFSKSDILPQLSLESLSSTGNIYSTKLGAFNSTVKCENNDYVSQLLLKLENAEGTVSVNVYQGPVVIGNGETKDFDMSSYVNVPAGTYTASVWYDPANNSSNAIDTYVQLGNSIQVEVKPAPTEAPVLDLVGTPSFADNDAVPRNNMEFTLTIKNTGGYFSDKVIGYIFPMPESCPGTCTSVGSLEQMLTLDTDEQKTIVLRGVSALEANDYRFLLRYKYNNVVTSFIRNPQIIFKLVDEEQSNPTGIEPETENILKIYPNPVTDILNIDGGGSQIESVRIIDLMGIEVKKENFTERNSVSVYVGDLSAGTYIVSVETENGLITGRFIKK